MLISRRAIAAQIDALVQAWQWTPDDTLVHGLPLFHVHGLILGLLGSLRGGKSLRAHRKTHPGRLRRRRRQPVLRGAHRVVAGVADTGAATALASARLLVSGSAALPVPVFTRLTELTGQPPVERYGSTESLITLSTRADGERRPGWVGLPLNGVETRLVHEDGSVAPHDGETIGSLHLKAPTVFEGYLNRPDATAEAFDPDGWYRTGDAAVIDGDGMHRIVGRESVDLIKSGGFRVGAGEVERCCSATRRRGGRGGGLPDTDLGQRIVAFVVGDANPDDLISFVAEQLSVHKRRGKCGWSTRCRETRWAKSSRRS